MAAPIFHRGRLVGFSGSIAHSPDIGGSLWSADCRELYEEGLRILPAKFLRDGELNHDLVDVIKNLNLHGGFMAESLEILDLGFLAVKSSTDSFEESLRDVLRGVDLTHTELVELIDRVPELAEELGLSEQKSDALERQLRLKLRLTLAETRRGFRSLKSEGVDPLTDAFEEAEDAARSYADTLREQSDPIFGLIRAQERYEQATRDTTKAIADHGINSRQARDAAIKEAEAYLDVRAAQEKLAEGFIGTRDDMRKLLAQMGMTPAAAELVIGELERIEGFKFSDKVVTVGVRAPEITYREVTRRGATVLQPGVSSRVAHFQKGGIAEEEMLARMKQKTRYNIRLAEKKGVTVRVGTLADLGMLYKMYAETSIRDGFVIRDEGYYKTVWELFMRNQPQFSNSPIFVYSRNPTERDFAVSLGAAWAGAIDQKPPVALDAIIDTTPVWGPVSEALKFLSPGGRLVVNAIRKESADQELLSRLDYPSQLWMEKEIKSVANVTRTDVREFLALAAEANGVWFFGSVYDDRIGVWSAARPDRP